MPLLITINQIKYSLRWGFTREINKVKRCFGFVLIALLNIRKVTAQ